MKLPSWMYVGNTITSKGNTGKTPVYIIKMIDGKYWDERGYSWKFATPINKD